MRSNVRCCCRRQIISSMLNRSLDFPRKTPRTIRSTKIGWRNSAEQSMSVEKTFHLWSNRCRVLGIDSFPSAWSHTAEQINSDVRPFSNLQLLDETILPSVPETRSDGFDWFISTVDLVSQPSARQMVRIRRDQRNVSYRWTYWRDARSSWQWNRLHFTSSCHGRSWWTSEWVGKE